MINLSLITRISLCCEKKVNQQLHSACLPAYNLHMTLLTTVLHVHVAPSRQMTSPISPSAKASFRLRYV